MYIKLEKAQKLIKQLRDSIIKPNIITLAKKKGKQATILKPALTDRLDLLFPFEDYLIIIVLILAIAYIVFLDYIINMSTGIMQVTDTKNWPEYTRNQVILVKSRLCFNYK